MHELARWREAGEWWRDEPYREFVRFVDDRGSIRERVEEAISIGALAKRIQGEPPPSDDDGQWWLRKRKPAVMEPSRCASGAAAYVPLHCYSGYAFGQGVIHVSELPERIASLGMSAAALVDPFSLVGAHTFAKFARLAGIKPLIGASIEMEDGGSLVLIAKSRTGYRNLSRLITECHLSEPRQYPLGDWERLERFAEDLICLTGGDVGPINRSLTRGKELEAKSNLERLVWIFGRSNVYVEIDRCYLPWEMSVNKRLMRLAGDLELRAVAGGLVTMRRRSDYAAQDVLVCAHTLCTIEEIVGRKPPRDTSQSPVVPRPARDLNAERFLRSPDEMARLFADAPDLLRNTLDVAGQCEDNVLPEPTRLPSIYEDDERMLEFLTYQGAHARYGNKLPGDLKRRLTTELERIVRSGFSKHFLVIADACRWAGEQGILFSGRGSVVDCVVAYCLGLSRIDAFAHKLHFDRFLPADGSRRPDIDIDFEAHRRDDVRNYLSRRYGPEHVATVAAVGTYGTRGIVREVSKVFGIPEETVSFLSKRIHGGVSPEYLETALQTRPELRNSNIPVERFLWVWRLAGTLNDLPRNMRAHSSGVVISDRPLWETVPVMRSAVEDVPIIQWDKRSAKPYFDKFDILCLRGQDVLSGTQQRVRLHDIDFKVEQAPLDDPETFRTMRAGQLIGIPQSASPAMRQAHMRLRTNDLNDASLVQAGIRPGVGGAVKLNELIARRRGLRPYEFEHPLLREILEKSYGVIVFQEQVDELLQKFCGYTSGQAEEIREAIHERKREDYGQVIREDLMERMSNNGFPPALANHVFNLIAGFKGYGFAQGHALAFAEISIRSVYCQQNYPAEYFAALLDAQPAGYYGPCTLANEARARGVKILPVDVNLSEESFLVEDVKSDSDPQLVVPRSGIRVSLKQVGGLSKELRERMVALRPYRSFFDFVARVHPARDELERLILVGAFDTFHSNRRSLLWTIPAAYGYAANMRSLHSGATSEAPTLDLAFREPEEVAGVEDFRQHEKAIHERSILGMDMAFHLMQFERERVQAKGGVLAADIDRLKPGTKCFVVGNPMRLRFPPTSSGKRVLFFDLEDESGLANVTSFDDVYQRDGHAIICHPYVTVWGEAQDRDGHIAFLALRIFPYKARLNELGVTNENLPIVTADFLVG